MNLVDVLLWITHMSGLVLIAIFYGYGVVVVVKEFTEDFKVISAARQKIKDLED